MGRRTGGREGSTVGWFSAKANLGALEERLELATVVADTGYFSEDNTGLDLGIELLIAPTKSNDLDEALAARIKADHPCDERQQESWAAKFTSAQARAARRQEIMTCLHGGHVTRAQDGPWHIDQQRQLVAMALLQEVRSAPRGPSPYRVATTKRHTGDARVLRSARRPRQIRDESDDS